MNGSNLHIREGIVSAYCGRAKNTIVSAKTVFVDLTMFSFRVNRVVRSTV